MLIHIIGPGGAGKTITGSALAERLDIECIDLDNEYLNSRSIDDDIRLHGYSSYAKKNTEYYLDLTATRTTAIVILSSGFMTYGSDIHPEVESIHKHILDSPTTILLMPSFDLEECVQEIVKRQMAKTYVKSSVVHQTEMIRLRFPIYRPMGNIQVTTNKPVSEVVDKIVSQLPIEGQSER